MELISSEKQCNRCGEVKSTSLFYRHKQTKDGYLGQCKACVAARNKADYASNRERNKAYARDYHNKNREAVKEKMRARYVANKDSRRDKALDKKLGKGASAFYKAEKAKSDKCRICGINESEAPKGRLAIDHCHETGKLRGLLCDKCNTAIGLFQDNVSNLTAAIEYLRNNR